MMILHKDGKEALANVVTNPNYQFLELSEMFLLSSQLITPVYAVEELIAGTCYAGVLHFDCDAPNLFGEGLGNHRTLVINEGTGGIDKIVYDVVLPIGYYSNQGASNLIFGVALVGGASKTTGGYGLVGGVPTYSANVSSGVEIIFSYLVFDEPLLKTSDTSVRLQVELQW